MGNGVNEQSKLDRARDYIPLVEQSLDCSENKRVKTIERIATFKVARGISCLKSNPTHLLRFFNFKQLYREIRENILYFVD